MQYVFHVSAVDGAYLGDKQVDRVFAIPAAKTLEDLCGVILDSLDFDFDHYYVFIIDEMYTGAPPTAPKKDRCLIKLKDLGLDEEARFTLIFDMGDSWEFLIELKEVRKGSRGGVEMISQIGTVEQYPDEASWDDVDWEANEWDDEPDEETDGEEDWEANWDDAWDADEDADDFRDDRSKDAEAFEDDGSKDAEAFEDDGPEVDEAPEELSWTYTPPEALFEAAFAYKKTKLWNKLSSEELFALRFADGEIGYICIMGMSGDHCAVGIYDDGDGIASFRELSFGQPRETRYEEQERVFCQQCLQVIIDSRDDLYDPEVEAVRHYAEKHGLRLSGKNAFPHFHRFRAHHLPWHPADEREEQHLLEALRAAINLSEILKGKKPTEFGFRPLTPETTAVPLLEAVDGKYRIAGEAAIPHSEIEEFEGPSVINEVAVQRVKRRTQTGTLACRLFMVPTPLQDEDDEQPHFPFVLLVADGETGMSYPPTVETEPDPVIFANEFLQILNDHEIRPRRILVTDERTRRLLQLVAQKIRAELCVEKELEILDALTDSILDDVAQGGDPLEAEMEQLLETMTIMSQMPASSLADIPQEALDEIRAILDMDILPPEIARQLERKLPKR